MNVLSRLFRRRKQQPAAGEARPAAVAPATSPATTPPARAPESPESPSAAPRPTTTPEQPEVPLRSLHRYRQDPAYRNFMAKAQKKPGAATRRPGIPADYLDGERRPR